MKKQILLSLLPFQMRGSKESQSTQYRFLLVWKILYFVEGVIVLD